VILIDSAGLRRTSCPVEAEGVRRSLAAAAAAHVVLSVRDATTLAGGGGDVQAAAADGSGGGGGSEAAGGDGAGEGWRLAPGAVQLHVASKADLLPGDWTEPEARAAAGAAAAAAAAEAGAAAPPAAAAPPDGQPLLVSCKTGQGMAALLAALQREVRRVLQRSGGDDGVGGALVTRARHRWGGPPCRACCVLGMTLSCAAAEGRCASLAGAAWLPSPLLPPYYRLPKRLFLVMPCSTARSRPCVRPEIQRPKTE
jgi:hypothetical protein